MTKPETPLSEEEIYHGKIVRLSLRQSRLCDGTPVQREIIRTPGAVVIVPVTATGEVRLVRQFRAAAERWLLELPAGTLDEGEAPDIAAPRELLEETGDRAANWHYLGGFYTAPGILTEYLHLYLATGLTPGPNHLEFDEHIEVVTLPWAEVFARIRRGEIEDAKTIAGLTRAALHLNLSPIANLPIANRQAPIPQTWTPIITALSKRQRFILSSHINPDCDALGSELALARHLQRLGKEIAILNSDPIPAAYTFLNGDGLIQTYHPEAHADLIARADAVIVLDVSGGWQRLGRVGEALSMAGKFSICIDHHPTDAPFTDLHHIDPQAAATAELIFDLIGAMGGDLTLPIAEALYTAIVTDTGYFRFSSTRPRTHRIAARLLACGVHSARIYRLLYEQQSLARMRLKGYMLQNISLTADGQIAWAGLSQETLRRFGVSHLDLNGFSGLPLQIGGVKISIFLVELPEGGGVKISFRSDGSVAVNRLAAQLGGGGHVPAAGATVPGQLAEVTERALAEASRFLSRR